MNVDQKAFETAYLTVSSAPVGVAAAELRTDSQGIYRSYRSYRALDAWRLWCHARTYYTTTGDKIPATAAPFFGDL